MQSQTCTHKLATEADSRDGEKDTPAQKARRPKMLKLL